MTILRATEHFSGKNGALKWSILAKNSIIYKNLVLQVHKSKLRGLKFCETGLTFHAFVLVFLSGKTTRSKH